MPEIGKLFSEKGQVVNILVFEVPVILLTHIRQELPFKLTVLVQ